MAKKITPIIIHQEEDFIIVNKPSGLLSIPDRYDISKPNLKYWLQNELKLDIFVVHRIDLETSGIMIFALNETSHKYFNGLFMNNKIHKMYQTIVEGRPDESREIDLRIKPSNSRKGLMETHLKGKDAFTSYTKVEQFKNLALLNVTIKTGRTHQIRVHLSSIGLPILGDTKYGSDKVFTLKDIKSKFNGEGSPLINRLALHARVVKFIHPTKNKMVEFIADYPKDLNVCLKQLRKWS